MAQSSLTPGPGTLVRDALAPTLASLTNATADVTGSWMDVEFPHDVAVFWEGGAIAGTGVSVDIQIEAADDAAGTNAVVLGKFATLDENDDNATKVLEVYGAKKYMRAVVTIAGTSPDVTGDVVVREKHDRRSASRSA